PPGAEPLALHAVARLERRRCGDGPGGRSVWRADPQRRLAERAAEGDGRGAGSLVQLLRVAAAHAGERDGLVPVVGPGPVVEAQFVLLNGEDVGGEPEAVPLDLDDVTDLVRGVFRRGIVGTHGSPPDASLAARKP